MKFRFANLRTKIVSFPSPGAQKMFKASLNIYYRK